MTTESDNPGMGHSIRSYVLRQSRMTAAQRRALHGLWPVYGLDDKAGMIDLERTFGRRAPTLLEIGFGRGDSLLTLAAAAPTVDFLGIEVHQPGIGHLLHEAERMGLSNIRVYRADARALFENCLPDAAFDRILVMFPDPWPKKKHHKRRLLNPGFLALLVGKMKPGGFLHLATDSPEYAESIEEILSGNEQLATASSKIWNRPVSKYEARAVKLGHRIVELNYCKTVPLNGLR